MSFKAKIWMNKLSEQIVVCVPWLVPVGDYIDLKAQLDKDEVPFCWGSFYQTGWLIETEKNIFLGLPMSVSDQFEEIGEL